MSPKKCMTVLLALAALLTLAACTASPAMEVTYAAQTNPASAQTSSPPTSSPEAAFTPLPASTPASSPSPTLQSPPTTPSKEPTPTPVNYEAYLGNWICSDDAKTRGEVFDLGGSAIQFTEINGDFISGNIIAISDPPGNRESWVFFSGAVENGKFEYTFEDDDWGDDGTITIEFAGNRLLVWIDCNISDDNPTGWCIGNGDYEFTRES